MTGESQIAKEEPLVTRAHMRFCFPTPMAALEMLANALNFCDNLGCETVEEKSPLPLYHVFLGHELMTLIYKKDTVHPFRLASVEIKCYEAPKEGKYYDLESKMRQMATQHDGVPDRLMSLPGMDPVWVTDAEAMKVVCHERQLRL